jgi:sulfonate transport system permease protein
MAADITARTGAEKTTAEAPARATGSRLSRIPGWGRLGLGLVLPVLILALWQTLSSTGVFTFVQLPPPLAVVDAAIELIQRNDMWIHVAISVQRVLLGFLLGAVLGLLLGSLVGLSRLADLLVAPTIGAFRAVPSLAWVPLLLLWIGLGEDSKVTLIAIGAFFPVYTTLAASLRHVDTNLVEAARSFGYSGIRLLLTVQLPAVVPSIFSGLRLALAQAWLFLVAAELLGASMGLGFLLTDSQNNGRTDRLLLAIVLLAIFGKITDALLGYLERKAVARWSA